MPAIIFVKFLDTVKYPYVDQLEGRLLGADAKQWEIIKGIAPSATFKRVYTMPRAEIEALINQVKERNKRYAPPPWDKRYALYYDEVDAGEHARSQVGESGILNEFDVRQEVGIEAEAAALGNVDEVLRQLIERGVLRRGDR